MSETNQLIPVNLSQEVVTASFTKELSAIKYQEALQALTDYEITRDNLAEAQDKIKKARGFVKKFGEIKDEGKRPYLQAGRYWDAAYNSLYKPFEDLITLKADQIQKIGNELAEENRKKEIERQRVDNIKKEIDNFIFTQTRAITGSVSTAEIVSIEKLIGSHKANTSRYQEFLPDLVERCNELTPLLKNQKENIKKLEDLKAQEEAARKAGDDAKVLELQEQKELAADKIEENKIVIQETAINSSLNTDVVVAEEVVVVPRPRRSSYSFRIVDEKKAFAAGMLSCELDKEKAKLVLSGIKDNVKVDAPQVINGIEYFLEVTF